MLIYEYDFVDMNYDRILEFKAEEKLDISRLRITGYKVVNTSPWTCISYPDYWRILIKCDLI